MSVELQERCHKLMVELGIVDPAEQVTAVPLTGGVASDIARVDVDGKAYCAKFALAKLKVAADWFAPVHRNAAEYAWLQVAASVAPHCAVQLYGRSENQHGFVMEFLQGDDVYLWKEHLLKQAPAMAEPEQVGRLVGEVHAASTQARFDARPFQNRDDFRALRIEPYITYTATRHADIADQLHPIADWLYDSQQVLVHGDVSPKNILFRSAGPVILDAECASMGDASFDMAFCMNHLVLKAIHLPGSRHLYLQGVLAMWRAYAPHVSWEESTDLERRICVLLPALMLGRVDGKSPVEYLSEQNRQIVRNIARRFIQHPTDKLEALVMAIQESLKESQT